MCDKRDLEGKRACARWFSEAHRTVRFSKQLYVVQTQIYFEKIWWEHSSWCCLGWTWWSKIINVCRNICRSVERACAWIQTQPLRLANTILEAIKHLHILLCQVGIVCKTPHLCEKGLMIGQFSFLFGHHVSDVLHVQVGHRKERWLSSNHDDVGSRALCAFLVPGQHSQIYAIWQLAAALCCVNINEQNYEPALVFLSFPNRVCRTQPWTSSLESPRPPGQSE